MIYIGSEADGRRATITKHGKVTYRIWYRTLIGENSTGWEKQHATVELAIADAQHWHDAIGRAREGMEGK